MKGLMRRGFLPVSTGILLITSCVKLISVFAGSDRLLKNPDPLFSFLKTKQVLWAAGSLELLIALLLLTLKGNRLIKLFMILCLSSAFIAYHGLYWFYGIEGPCKCLGSLTEWLPMIPPEILSKLMFLISVYLFIGSYALTFAAWRERHGNAAGRLAETA